ncbi:MAG: hypothetical protein AABY80_00620, partial [Candidatus Deferrimicrobiota bacterium]
MNARRRFVALAALAVLVTGVAAGVAILSLYRVGLARDGEALDAVVRGQVAMAEAVFQSELTDLGGDTAAAVESAVQHVRAATRNFTGFGRAG